VVGAITAMAVVMGIAALPSASSAEPCVVTIKLLGGSISTLTLDLPPGTIPSLPLGASLLSVSCTPTTTTSTQTTSTPTQSTPTSTQTSTPTSTQSTPSTPSTTPTTSSTSSNQSNQPTTSTRTTHSPGQKSGSNNSGYSGNSGTGGGGGAKGQANSAAPPAPAPLRGSGGVPSPSNPTFSFALPGAAPIGVPNFFIDNFQIPPFLLPIYQAAGIEYDVPWQVLAAINEIESDYGRNLSVSSAGAVGWMQFLPSTWKQWAVAATGNGIADPYNPVDAIFTAARYLHAAGASKNLSGAIFAYNHADWYVQSVLLRAKLIGGLPSQFIGALTGLVEGHFPVAAPARYADDYVESLASKKVKSGNPAISVESNPSQKAVSIYSKQGSPVIAANDGKVLAVGQNQQWGKYLQLQDANGNVYTYANLGDIPKDYPVPKPVPITAGQIAKELSATRPPKPSTPATAGSQQAPAVPSTKQATKAAAKGPKSLPTTTKTSSGSTNNNSNNSAVQSVPQAQPKERLFAYPSRQASNAAGGGLQLHNLTRQISDFQSYFSDVLHLGKNQYTLQPLKAGATVVAGTIIGRVAGPSPTQASHLQFMVKPAGKGAPFVDPKPILDGWKLLEATAVYRAAGLNPFVGKNPTIGQILLMSKEQLQNRVLQDPHVQIYACGRRDIQSGTVDRRIMAVIEFLSASGLDPTVSGLVCGANAKASNGVDSAGSTGSSADISKINGIPIAGHQGKGTITDMTIRRLLTLQGTFKPNQIISTMSYKGQSDTLSLPDHKDRIQVTYTPAFGSNKKLAAQVASILQPGQWVQLINRIGQLPEPVVPIRPSGYAIKVGH
jgi:murein DD-endopeptidase MepM/ murein hydrolase activator NlpD